MNPPKVDDLNYIHFLIAAQKAFTCTEAACSQPDGDEQAGPAHDAFTRLLQSSYAQSKEVAGTGFGIKLL